MHLRIVSSKHQGGSSMNKAYTIHSTNAQDAIVASDKRHSALFPDLIENAIENICEFNRLLYDVKYQKYIPLKVIISDASTSIASGAVMYMDSEPLQALRIANALYQHLDRTQAVLEAGGYPTVSVTVDGWTVALLSVDDQDALVRYERLQRLLESKAQKS